MDFTPATPPQLEWVRLVTEPLVRAGVAHDPERLGGLFDAERAAWFAQPEAERQDPSGLLQAVGGALGQLLVERHGLEWGVLADDYGTDVAVASPDRAMVLAPLDVVAKRWTDADPEPLATVIADVVARIERVRGWQAGRGAADPTGA